MVRSRSAKTARSLSQIPEEGENFTELMPVLVSCRTRIRKMFIAKLTHTTVTVSATRRWNASVDFELMQADLTLPVVDDDTIIGFLVRRTCPLPSCRGTTCWQSPRCSVAILTILRADLYVSNDLVSAAPLAVAAVAETVANRLSLCFVLYLVCFVRPWSGPSQSRLMYPKKVMLHSILFSPEC